MRFSSVLFFLLVAAPAGATCFVCDEVVELTDKTAACFEESFDVLMDAIETAPAGRQSVNFGACDGTDEASRREGLLEMGELPLDGQKQIKTVYILDRASALCLRDLIAGYDGPFDPSVAFDLVELCNGE